MDCAEPFDNASFGPAALSRRSALIGLGSGGLALLLAGGAVLATAQQASPADGVRAYLVIRQYQLAPGRTMEALSALVERGFIPILQQVPGFREYFLVESDGGPQSISVFTDQAGAEESTRRAADWIQQNLTGYFTGLPTVTTGSVWLHDVGRELPGTPSP
jgi:hypothetical protein